MLKFSFELQLMPPIVRAGGCVCGDDLSPSNCKEGHFAVDSLGLCILKEDREKGLEVLHLFRECDINFGIFSSNAVTSLSHIYKINVFCLKD